MLTRLRVSGFKNLLDAEVFFGPFTCIAGVNGVGKSNLFDAISFLRLLTHQSLVEAALSVRDEAGKSTDIRSLCFHHGDAFEDVMSFDADIVVPKEAMDDLGQRAVSTSTYLRYQLELKYRGEDCEDGPLEVTREQLDYITKGEAMSRLRFHPHAKWVDSAVVAGRRGSPFISTKVQDGRRVVSIHQDGTSGRPQPSLATKLKRTVLSSVRASDARTAAVVRDEMMNWRLLQFEPTSLRKADEFRAPITVSSNGAHMPSALRYLMRHSGGNGQSAVQQSIANRIADLVGDIQTVWLDEDSKRELVTLHARLRDGTDHPARSLSDGTLRFLALAIIEQGSESGGLMCLEEPENGIHPDRIPAMLDLLQSIAVDASDAIDRDNALRQVIVNTHSPGVVGQVPDESLVVAERAQTIWRGERVDTVRFSALPGTWRTEDTNAVSSSRGHLLGYLNPIGMAVRDEAVREKPRVIDRTDIRQLVLPYEEQVPGEE